MSNTDGRASAGPDVVTCELDDGLVVLCLRRKMYYNLDAPGRLVWEAFDKGLDVDAAAAALSGVFAVDRQTARRDTEALASSFVEAGLIAFEGSHGAG